MQHQTINESLNTPISRSELAQFSMLLEVTARCKPGNIDRDHDYKNTRLEHFLASSVRVRSVFSEVEQQKLNIGEAILKSVACTNNHSGGNTHFGSFILLIPLILAGNIYNAKNIVRQTTVEDAINFYKAFNLTEVRMYPSDPMDVNNPESIQKLIDDNITMYDIMEYSAPHDMVAREWTNNFELTNIASKILLNGHNGIEDIPKMYMYLLANYPDTFIAKKFDDTTANMIMQKAKLVLDGSMNISLFDEECLSKGINPGSIADICVSGIYCALMEGWKWDC
ncbi:MAG TPA: triphosphoribosyl-dephospho-CoA synthase [Methanocorpusculum sp.]|nr:triphosphoribosyl-dephospho-CoA synthase [Methanocorpusculum sp.]